MHSEVPPPIHVLQLLFGRWISHALTSAARLGVADALAAGPKTTEELAQSTGTHPPSLYRVLRLLASNGVFFEHPDGRFANTPASETLRKDVPDTTRPMALLVNHPALLENWKRLDQAIETGTAQFAIAHGDGFWDFAAKNPDFAATFNDAMTALSAPIAPAVAATYDFSGIGTLVDVGGGQGLLLTTILSQYPKLGGILFDLPAVLERAKPLVERTGARGRCELVGGDFFTRVPSADAYLMKHILHDWSDEDAVAILKCVHRAAERDAKLLVVESVMKPGNDPDLGKMIDVEMLMSTGGRERTEAEYGELFRRAGFRLGRVVPTPSPVCVVEAVRA